MCGKRRERKSAYNVEVVDFEILDCGKTAWHLELREDNDAIAHVEACVAYYDETAEGGRVSIPHRQH